MANNAVRKYSATIIGVLALMSGLLDLPAYAGPKLSQLRLQGTFLQLQPDVNRTDEDWRELFGCFEKLRLSEIIVQWTVTKGQAVYRSQLYPVAPNAALETVLTLADKHRMKVLVGLVDDAALWQHFAAGPLVSAPALERWAQQSQAVAKELLPLVKKHRSFRGWYVTQEIDDHTWTDPQARDSLYREMHRLSAGLRAMRPKRTVAVSGFTNGTRSAAELGALWTGLLTPRFIDTVFFQDGIGVNKLRLENAAFYLTAVRKAVEARSARFRLVVEVFEQTDGEPINNSPFHAKPAALERIHAQLRLARECSSNPPVAFSVPEYMTPFGGSEAEELMNQYLAGLKRRR